MRNVIQKATEEMISIKRRTKKSWFNRICEDYTMKAINILRCEKSKHIQNLIREVNQDYAGQKTRNLYRKINIF